MSDVDQLLVANLIEALRELQRYVIMSLGTSVSAAALSFASAAPKQKQGLITVPGTSVATHPGFALVLLLALSCLAGAMAYFSAETANETARLIRSRAGTAAPELLLAISRFPSIATSPYAVVRYIAVLLPLLFSLMALLRTALRERPVAGDALRGWLILFAVCYLPLAIELWRPIGGP